MKLQNLYVKCDSADQCEIVLSVLIDGGCRWIHNSGGLIVGISSLGDIQILRDLKSGNKYGKIINFTHFMKVNCLNLKVEEAKNILCLNSSNLSLSLGYSKPYISKTLTGTPSEKKIDKLCVQLDELISSAKNKTIAACGYLAKSNHDIDLTNHNKCDFKKDITDPRDLEIKYLNKTIDEKNEIIKQLDTKAFDLQDDIREIDAILEEKREIIDTKNKVISTLAADIDKYESRLVDAKRKLKGERFCSVMTLIILLVFLIGGLVF